MRPWSQVTKSAAYTSPSAIQYFDLKQHLKTRCSPAHSTRLDFWITSNKRASKLRTTLGDSQHRKLGKKSHLFCLSDIKQNSVKIKTTNEKRERAGKTSRRNLHFYQKISSGKPGKHDNMCFFSGGNADQLAPTLLAGEPASQASANQPACILA